MTKAEGTPLRLLLLDEIAEEMSGLEGAELDEFLSDVGLEPAILLVDFDRAITSMNASPGRRRFDTARASLSKGIPRPQLVDLDAARKRRVFDEIKRRMAETNEMTIAARNQKMDSETDLDRFLEACLGLGIIDENGQLKD